MVTERPQIQIRRIYDDPFADDGIRVLVDHGHSADRYGEFEARYREELQEPKRASALRHLRVMSSHDRLTLLTATRQVHLSQAAVLLELLRS